MKKLFIAADNFGFQSSGPKIYRGIPPNTSNRALTASAVKTED